MRSFLISFESIDSFSNYALPVQNGSGKMSVRGNRFLATTYVRLPLKGRLMSILACGVIQTFNFLIVFFFKFYSFLSIIYDEDSSHSLSIIQSTIPKKMATCTFSHNSIRTETTKYFITSQTIYPRIWKLNFEHLLPSHIFWEGFCTIRCNLEMFRFAKDCGKTYSRHLFLYREFTTTCLKSDLRGLSLVLCVRSNENCKIQLVKRGYF